MKLIDVQVDGFGVWHNLELHKLSPQWTVYYGPNEAGKTTLMQFILRGAVRLFARAASAILAPRARRYHGWSAASCR